MGPHSLGHLPPAGTEGSQNLENDDLRQSVPLPIPGRPRGNVMVLPLKAPGPCLLLFVKKGT